MCTKVNAGLAQLVEHLICNQAVGGSIPLASSIFILAELTGCFARVKIGLKSLRRGDASEARRAHFLCVRSAESQRQRSIRLFNPILLGEVPEWLNGADCKSAGLRLRQFESAPPHHLLNGVCFSFLFAGVAQLARASAFQAEC